MAERLKKRSGSSKRYISAKYEFFQFLLILNLSKSEVLALNSERLFLLQSQYPTGFFSLSDK